jgi:hypothetical protein
VCVRVCARVRACSVVICWHLVPLYGDIKSIIYPNIADQEGGFCIQHFVYDARSRGNAVPNIIV